jgi:hypothetical protein
MPILQVFTRIL